MPLMGRGEPRVFLGEMVINVAWSPDGARLVYHTRDDGDPIFVADRNGANPRRIVIDQPGVHHHYPTWSLDGKWIYFVQGVQATYEWDLWRIAAAGGKPERLTQHNSEVGYPAPIDLHTILYVARERDGSGPWLWALDPDRKQTRRVSFGLEKYTSLAASADGRRLVASVANPTASLWSVPILDRPAEEPEVTSFPLPTARALMPRFGGTSLFYVSSRGEGDGLWRYRAGESVEIWKGSDGSLLEPPAVSADSGRSAIVLRRDGKLRLYVVSADGGDIQPLTDGIDVRGSASWSPDGKWIVTEGIDSKGSRVVQGARRRRRTDTAHRRTRAKSRVVARRQRHSLFRGKCRAAGTVASRPTGWNSIRFARDPVASRRRALPLSSKRTGRRLHAGVPAVTGFLAARPGHEQMQATHSPER